MADLTDRERKALTELQAAAEAVCDELESAIAGESRYLKRDVVSDQFAEGTGTNESGAEKQAKDACTEATRILTRYEEARAEARHLGLLP